MTERKIRPYTKKWYIEEIKKVIAEHEVYSEKLAALVQEGKVNGGCLLVYGTTRLYTFQWLYGLREGEKSKLYGWVYEETKVSSYKSQLQWILEDLSKIQMFLDDESQTGWTKNNK